MVWSPASLRGSIVRKLRRNERGSEFGQVSICWLICWWQTDYRRIRSGCRTQKNIWRLEVDHRPSIMITVEEAHRFLNPLPPVRRSVPSPVNCVSISSPAGGGPASLRHPVNPLSRNRITALLNDEKDIQAVFTGVSVPPPCAISSLSGLKQQALVLSPPLRCSGCQNPPMDLFSAGM